MHRPYSVSHVSILLFIWECKRTGRDEGTRKYGEWRTRGGMSWRTIFTSRNVQINLFYANSTKYRDVTYGPLPHNLCVDIIPRATTSSIVVDNARRRHGRKTCTNFQWNLFQFQWNWIRPRHPDPIELRKWRDNGNCFGNFYRFNLKDSSQRVAGSVLRLTKGICDVHDDRSCTHSAVAQVSWRANAERKFEIAYFSSDNILFE